MLVFRYCPKCKNNIGYDGNVRGIGTPLVECNKCGTNIFLTHIYEWEQLSNWGKIKHWFVVLYTIIMFSFVIPVLFLIVFENIKYLYLLFMGIFIFVVFGAYKIRQESIDIKDSIARMKDNDYRIKVTSCIKKEC